MPPLREICLPRRAGLGPAPTADTGAIPFYKGRTLAGPQIYTARPGGRALQPSTSRHLLGKARRSCGTAAAAIFEQPGPSGPVGIWTATQILRAGNSLPDSRGNPRNGVRGKATMSTKCSSEPVPIPSVPSGHLPLIRGVGPGGVLPNPSLLPAKPSEAGSPGRGGARERTQFSPPGGNGVEWTLRRRAAVGKVTRRPQAAKFSL